MKSVSKLKHQVKSSRYYLFWGAATIAVMAGQIYIGNGYRNMSRSIDSLVRAIMYEPEPRGYYEPLVPPPTGFSQNPKINPDDYVIWLETE